MNAPRVRESFHVDGSSRIHTYKWHEHCSSAAPRRQRRVDTNLNMPRPSLGSALEDPMKLGITSSHAAPFPAPAARAVRGDDPKASEVRATANDASNQANYGDPSGSDNDCASGPFDADAGVCQ
jgi:hypothetical protein